jgi:phosphoribosyl 1,2-cyclic phosphate phosphodiesterase
VLGFRFGKLAYLTDFSAISDAELAKLEGVDVLVVNALRWERHSSHFSVDEALELVRRVRPRRAFLTHLSHDIGLYAEAQRRLPEGVEFAYDGLEIEI